MYFLRKIFDTRKKFITDTSISPALSRSSKLNNFLSFRETSHDVESSALSLIEDEVTISEGLQMDQLSPQPITLKTSQLSIIEDDGIPVRWTPKTDQISPNEDDRTAVDGEFSTEIQRSPVDLDTECELESSFLYQYPTDTGNKQISKNICFTSFFFILSKPVTNGQTD